MNHIAKTAQLASDVVLGENITLGENVIIREGTSIADNCYIGDNCTIGCSSYIDRDVIIRPNVTLGRNGFVGARSIVGEFLNDFVSYRKIGQHLLSIGCNSVIRSETIIYGGSQIGDSFQTGHRVTIRENSRIGHHVHVGTLSDIQGICEIGNYVNMHSNVHVGQKSVIGNYVWLFPYVVVTNDPNPPSENLLGVTIKDYAVVATNSILLPGITIEEDTLIGAGAIVTKDIPQGMVAVGNPAKVVGPTDKIANKVTGQQVYPWRYTFDRGMPWQDIGYEQWEEAISRKTENHMKEREYL